MRFRRDELWSLIQWIHVRVDLEHLGRSVNHLALWTRDAQANLLLRFHASNMSRGQRAPLCLKGSWRLRDERQREAPNPFDRLSAALRRQSRKARTLAIG